ncbi:MAG TPA: excinuclease ABC subunit C [Dehalococcoidia bacterium]|nr:excinuclease ABC subunit C [Chloroflexota bacterium]HCE75930.1 excinuclease ABC subunit C [Dehalococcoidia bacterium]|tara:strand:- start:18288 stop:20117 length:1830 start_codon:yes stop_codon:yes gene_type:complete
MTVGKFTERLAHVPTGPGVYLMRDVGDGIIYVGKASNLRNRLRSYFVPDHHDDLKTRVLVSEIREFEFIVTESEQEALILECNLIKEYQPRFNSRLKDDKSYPFIKIDNTEAFPQVYITRNVQNDDAQYFGPYANAGSVRKTLGLLKKLFPYRSCTKIITGTDDRACLDFHINRCIGPCIGAASKDQYRDIIDQVILFLEGNTSQIVGSLKKRMDHSAESLEFEKAAVLRDQIRSIQKVHEGQKVLTLKPENIDVVAGSLWSNDAWIEIFFIRQGKLIGRDSYLMEVGQHDDIQSVQNAFLQQFYEVAPYVPPIVLTQMPVGEEDEQITEFLSTKRGSTVRLYKPIRGEKRKLIEMVSHNAREGLDQHRVKKFARLSQDDSALKELQEALNLPRLPDRIECYDISNIQGSNAVGSMVVFEKARPKNSDYRRFQIKNVDGVDDYSMMREMLTRRFKRLIEKKVEHTSWTKDPDLVLIDGGKGHLGVALQVFLELGVTDIPLASLAKENEELFVPYMQESIALPRNSHALFLVQRARDEAHRFAITYHRNKRSKVAFKSTLDSVAGIGPQKRKALLKGFGSLKNIRAAGIEELTQIEGITTKLAEKIKDTI